MERNHFFPPDTEVPSLKGARPKVVNMVTNVIGLMRFVHGLRKDFFERAAGLGWKAFVRDRGTSMHSFRNVFLHLATVEEQHILQFCEGLATPWPDSVMRVPKDMYVDIAAVRQRLDDVTSLGERQFRKWDSSRALGKKVVWVAERSPLRVTRDTALMQCATEHLLHLGEVEAMLWQLDVEPPTTFWIERMFLRGRWPPPKSLLVAGPRGRPYDSRSPTARRRR